MQRALGPGSPSCVAVHVRHGDSCDDQAQPRKRCFSLQQHMTAARALLRRYGGRKHVYVATDDAGVLKDLERGAREGGAYADLAPRWQAYRHIKHYGRGVRGATQSVDDNEAIATPAAAQEMYLDLWAMSQCDLFVGTLSSSVAWTTLALMTARHARYPPSVSMEEDVTLADPTFHGKIGNSMFED